MIYEFECPKGHVTEAMVPIGTESYLCAQCQSAWLTKYGNPFRRVDPALWTAKRILSPTRTTFEFADKRRR